MHCILYQFKSISPRHPSQVAHTLSLAYTAYMWYLWWEKWGLKALKFLQLHLFKQFLIILPRNYKTSGTRANLTINCASSICKGIQIKCRCLSPKLDSCAPWTIQHPAWTQFPIPQLKTLSRLGRQILGLSAVTSAPSLPFPVSYSFQGACPWAKKRKPSILFAPWDCSLQRKRRQTLGNHAVHPGWAPVQLPIILRASIALCWHVW